MHWSDELLRTSIGSDPRRGRLEFTPRTFETPEEALAALREHGGQGWICLASELRLIPADGFPEAGVPLWAELVDSAGRSFHLRQVSGRWQGHTIVSAPPTANEEHLIFEHRLARIPRGSMSYEVAWRREDDEGNPSSQAIWRAWAYRFTGMEDV